MFNPTLAKPFVMFSLTHLIMLIIAVVSIALLYFYRNKFTPKTDKIFRYGLASFMIIAEVVFRVWSAPGSTFTEMLPLGLCVMTMWITSIALIFNLKGVIKIILPWSFVGALLSFIVVDMNYAFPHFRFIHYFFNHLFFLLGNLYFLFTSKIKYTYKDLNRSIYTLLIVAGFILVINLILKTNHMFLVELPDGVKEMASFIPFPLTTILLIFGIYLIIQIFYFTFVYKKSYEYVELT